VQRQIKESLPIAKRVSIIAKVAEESDNPFAQLKAVTYANELDDIHPSLEREKIRKGNEASQPQPMFSLPAGTSIAVTVQHTIGSGLQKESEVVNRVIDVTPNDSARGK
jgi:hypothetical protein